MSNGEIIKDSSVEDAFNDNDILNKASLTEPFVLKVKKVMKINNDSVRNIENLKEVISHE
jgi:hypothetical protein